MDCNAGSWAEPGNAQSSTVSAGTATARWTEYDCFMGK